LDGIDAIFESKKLHLYHPRRTPEDALAFLIITLFPLISFFSVFFFSQNKNIKNTKRLQNIFILTSRQNLS
jgi:hypothetical protein